MVGDYEWETTVYGCGLGMFFTLVISTTEKIPFCIENLKVSWTPSSMF